MKYELENTSEMYIKVYPYSNSWRKAKEEDLYEIEREIKRHVDDINDTECIVEQKYLYLDEEAEEEYEGLSLTELCRNVAISRGLIEESDYRWEITWNRNNEAYRSYVYDFEELLEYVSRYNCEIVKGKLTKEQEVLVEIAREFYD